MAIENNFSQQLLNLLATRNFHPELLDQSGRPTDSANDAKTLTFDYVSSEGKNYGTMVIILDVDNDMKVMYGDNLGRTMEADDKQEFFDFVQQLNQKATTNRWTHTVSDISQLKHVMQGIAAIQEGLFEGYYGNSKISWTGQPTEARLRIVHNRVLDENDARHRYIDRMFIETAEGECFKLGFKSLAGGKAMLEHVRQGGRPYDVRGCHITEMVNEIAVLSRFNRASGQRILEGATQQLITEAQAYYQTVRENLRSLAHSRGYQRYFESWHPANIAEQDHIIGNIKTLFVEQTIDSRIEAALPLLAKIQQQGESMKEIEIFEHWADRLVEGTWNLPETPEQMNRLMSMMTKELIVGPDAINATEQLSDLVGDDILFDRLSELAARDPRANAWNDTEVMARLAELGIATPNQSPAGASDEAESSLKEVSLDLAKRARDKAERHVDWDEDDMRDRPEGYSEKQRSRFQRYIDRKEPRAPGDRDWDPSKQGMAEGLISTYVLNVMDEATGEHWAIEIRSTSPEMAKERAIQQGYKVLRIKEKGVAEGLKDVVQKVGAAAKKVGGAALDRIAPGDEELLRDLQRRAGVPQHAQHGKPSMAQSRPDVSEGQCNMTAEGKYCPRHGLAECAMEEDSTNPMDARHAVTDSFYESEIDRIKKLALNN